MTLMPGIPSYLFTDFAPVSIHSRLHQFLLSYWIMQTNDPIILPPSYLCSLAKWDIKVFSMHEIQFLPSPSLLYLLQSGLNPISSLKWFLSRLSVTFTLPNSISKLQFSCSSASQRQVTQVTTPFSLSRFLQLASIACFPLSAQATPTQAFSLAPLPFLSPRGIRSPFFSLI